MGKYNVKIGIIGGSGLDDPNIIENRKETTVETPFGDPSDVLIEGVISGVQCVLLARHGRKHTIMPSNVNYRANIWALKMVGCTHVVATTACGSLREEIPPGTFVVLDSFIDRTRARKQTFYDGEHCESVGVCHLPMDPAFCNEVRQILISTIEEHGYSYRPAGTAVVVEGPRFSSRAESLMFRNWGGDVINMTTVPEVVLAKEAGMCYAVVAMATDYDCWRTEGKKVCVEDVLKTFKANVEKIINIIRTAIPKINKESWDAVIDSLKNTVKTSTMLPPP